MPPFPIPVIYVSIISMTIVTWSIEHGGTAVPRGLGFYGFTSSSSSSVVSAPDE